MASAPIPEYIIPLEFAGFTNGVDIFAIKLLEETGDALVVTIDADGGEDSLDITSAGRGVSTNLAEEVGCEVLHVVGWGYFLEVMFVLVGV